MSHDELPFPERLRPILAELRALELLLQRAAPDTSREAFARMLTADFREIGASGRRYDRDDVLDALEARQRTPFEDVWNARDFDLRELGEDHYLLTYVLEQGARITRRMTIWRRAESRFSEMAWNAVYHQGTIVA